jgi:hypothetical protein
VLARSLRYICGLAGALACRNIAASPIRIALPIALPVTPQIAQNTLCKIATVASASIDISGRAETKKPPENQGGSVIRQLQKRPATTR